MSEIEKFQLVAETLRAEAKHPGALVKRARMVILAEHFERLARIAANDTDSDTLHEALADELERV